MLERSSIDYSSFGLRDKVAIVTGGSQGIGRAIALGLAHAGAHVERVRAVMERAHSAFGRIDILVNNAGWTGTTPALDVSEEEYDRTMAASLKSVFFASQAAARVMIPQGWGRII